MQIMSMGLNPQESARPWRWSARACQVANAQGDYTLAPRVFLFANWWKGLKGQLTMNDYMDMLLDQIPPDADHQIVHATAEAISHLPDDHRIGPANHEVMTVGQIRTAVNTAVAV